MAVDLEYDTDLSAHSLSRITGNRQFVDDEDEYENFNIMDIFGGKKRKAAAANAVAAIGGPDSTFMDAMIVDYEKIKGDKPAVQTASNNIKSDGGVGLVRFLAKRYGVPHNTGDLQFHNFAFDAYRKYPIPQNPTCENMDEFYSTLSIEIENSTQKAGIKGQGAKRSGNELRIYNDIRKDADIVMNKLKCGEKKAAAEEAKAAIENKAALDTISGIASKTAGKKDDSQTIIYVVGGVLLIGAAYFLFFRKKSAAA